MISATVTTREFERAMDELVRLTGRADGEIITNTTKGVMINLVRFTSLFRRIKNRRFRWMTSAIEKFAKGRARLGWWPAWKALRMAGAPNIGNGPLKDRREGGITDRSKRIGRPYITVYNEVPYIRTLDRKKRIVARATSRQFQFLKRAVEREYSRIMRSKSG